MRRCKHVGDEEEDGEDEEGPDSKPDGNRLIGPSLIIIRINIILLFELL